jgi:hypothetical protein
MLFLLSLTTHQPTQKDEELFKKGEGVFYKMRREVF